MLWQLALALVSGGVIGRVLFFGPERNNMVAEASDRAIAAVSRSLDRVQLDLQAAYVRIDSLQDENQVLRQRIVWLEDKGFMCPTCPLRRDATDGRDS